MSVPAPPPQRQTGAVGITLIVLGVGLLLWMGLHERRRADVEPPSKPEATTAAFQAPAPAPTAQTPPTAAPPPPAPPAEVAYPGLESQDLGERNHALFEEMQHELALEDAQIGRVREIFGGSSWLGQGNPKIAVHPMTRAECRERRAQAGQLPSGDPRCQSPNMVPLYDPSAGETAANARTCIDQYEFPNIPCEYPVVWVKADEAVTLCRAVGKRICDAHEWEGACAGALKKPEREYAFGQRRLMIEYLHNLSREIVWSYGQKKDHSKCATMSSKSTTCNVIDWGTCGSNTYPAGAFPECHSPLGAFDLNGNAAEHMNLPLIEAQLASRGGLGETEMKGSWFIFSKYEAHPDDCRWRAPMWHKTRIDDKGSHRNYHLGFRCCRDI